MTWHGERWEDRRFRAWLIRAVVFVVPVVAAIVVATVVANSLPDPDGLWESLAWWALVLGSSFGTMWLVDRIARQLLPLAALLRMSLVFPDKAPSRFSVALRSNSSRRMQADVEEARAAGVDDDPTRAAEFVLAMVASLGDHDRLTRGHAERTRAYTDLLAEELGIPLDDRDRLRWVALLHDVGKLGVPAEVLSSDHELTDEDWAHVRNHPADGYELTRPIHDFLGPWALTILHHHEQYDGSGYPTGIVGEDIAYGARVVAVGDAYDAMTAFRTYQPALSTAAARKELAAGAGTQFDPHVVRAFLSLSMGSLRRVAGPLAFLGQLPFIGGLRRLGDTATAAVATTAALGLALVGGLIPGPNTAVSVGDIVPSYANQDVSEFEVSWDGNGTFDPNNVDPDTVLIVQSPAAGIVAPNADGVLVYLPEPGPVTGDRYVVELCDMDGDCVSLPVVVLPEDDIVASPPGGGDQGEPVPSNPPPPAATTTSSTTSSTTTTLVTTTTGFPTPSTLPPQTTTTAPPATTTTSVPPTTTTSTVPPTTTTTTTTTTVAPTTTTSVAPTTTTSTTTTTTTTTLPPAPPDAMPDNATTDEDVPIVIPVLANDSDPDGDLDPATLTLATAAGQGTATVVGSAIDYTPAADVFGADTFDYEICDAGGRCSTAAVTVTIAPVNDPPAAVDDAAAGQPRTLIVIDVLSNDTDIDGGPLTISGADPISALGGFVVCGTECTYTPPDPWTGPDTFSYVVGDGAGGVAAATVTVTPTTPDIELFLRAAGAGDQTSTPVLPLSTGAGPTNATLPNYDTNRDTGPGLLLQQVEAGPGQQLSETDPARYQLWSYPVAGDLVLNGDASMDLWAGMAALQSGVHGRLRVFVLDCPAGSIDGTNCVEIARERVDRDPWTAVDMQWERAAWDFGTLAYTIPAGRSLSLKVVVAGPNADDDMRLGFDAVGFESSFVLRAG